MTLSSVNEVKLSSSSIGINSVVTLSSVNEVTSSLINEIISSPINKITSSSPFNEITSSLINRITIIANPTSSSQLNNCNYEGNSQESSSGPIIGVGVLLFTNIITVIIFIISCLYLLRSRRRHEKL